MADMMFMNLTPALSVHLAPWFDKKHLKNLQKLLGKENAVNELIMQMRKAREITEKGHSLRKEKGIPVRQPLKSVTISKKRDIDIRLEKLIKDELNVKEIIWQDRKGEMKIKLDTKITAELEEEMKTRDLIRKIQEERKNMGLNLTQKVTVQNEWLPQNNFLTQWIIKKAQVSAISAGVFKVNKVD
jgi:isoleucyl-tRNA synthetase